MKIKLNDKAHFSSIQLVVFSLDVLFILGIIGYFSFKAVKMDKKPINQEVIADDMPHLSDYTTE